MGTHSIDPANVALAIEVIRLSCKFNILELCFRGSLAANKGDPEIVFAHAGAKAAFAASVVLHSYSVTVAPSSDRIRFLERSRNLRHEMYAVNV